MLRMFDDSDSFGRKIVLKLTIPEGFKVSRAFFISGELKKDLGENPTFPFELSLTRSETGLLQPGENTGYLIVYDQNDKKRTIEKYFTFPVAPPVMED